MPEPRRDRIARIGAELAYVAWRMEWAAGRLWCRHSCEAGTFLQAQRIIISTMRSIAPC